MALDEVCKILVSLGDQHAVLSCTVRWFSIFRQTISMLLADGIQLVGASDSCNCFPVQLDVFEPVMPKKTSQPKQVLLPGYHSLHKH